MKDTLFGIPTDILVDELKCMGLDPNISNIKENGLNICELDKDNITCEQLDGINFNEVKDWNDYVYIHEKFVSDEIDFNTGVHSSIIDIYYTINNRPIYGEGHMKTTGDVKEKTLIDYLDKHIFHKYDNNPYIKVRKIKQI